MCREGRQALGDSINVLYRINGRCEVPDDNDTICHEKSAGNKNKAKENHLLQITISSVQANY